MPVNKITVKSEDLEKLLSFAAIRGPKGKEAVKFRVSDNRLSVPFSREIDVKSKTSFQVEISFSQVKTLVAILKHVPDQDITLTLDANKGIIIDRLKLL